MPRFDPISILFFAGILYIAMPLMVWSVLYRRHALLNVACWCLSSGCVGAGFCIAALRANLPDTLAVVGGNGMLVVAATLKIPVLRLERAMPGRWLTVLAIVLAGLAGCWLSLQLPPSPRSAVNLSISGAAALWVAWNALRLAAEQRSRSAAYLGWCFGIAGAAALLRALRVGAGWTDGLPVSPQWDYMVALALAMVAALIGNVAYIGLVLERTRRAERVQRNLLERFHEDEQAKLLASRTRAAVAEERARTTQLLAHEVRQPLHNAAVALQSAVATLARSSDPTDAARAIVQAQAVIQRVGATLDNTVAATTMLGSNERITPHDTDLEMLADLCITDLPPEARTRVQLDYRADARSALVEPSLLRLAVRNLLLNATLYSPPGTPVTLRLLDSDDPLALVIEVADEGPGVPDELLATIFDAGVRGPQPTVPGHGLGLHVVKRVARLHGGDVCWLPNQPRGSIFRLTLPQGHPA